MEEMRPARDARLAGVHDDPDHSDRPDFRGSRGVQIGQAGIQQNFFLDPATIGRLVAATRSRPWLLPSAMALLGAALISWTAAALTPSPAVAMASAIGGGICLLLGCAFIAILVTAKIARARQLSRHLRRFLTIQRENAMTHRYRFFDGHVPELSEILVQQRSKLQVTAADSEPEQPISVLSMLSRHEHIVLVGGAGSGKSTAAAFVTTQASDHILQQPPTGQPPPVGDGIPLVVPARELVDSSVPAAVRRTIVKNFGAELAEWLPEDFYEQRRWLLLVDGLDEITGREERSRALHRLSSLLDTGSRNYRLAVLTRPLLYTELVSLQRRGAALYELLPFDAGELAEFAEKWFAARSALADLGTAGEVARRFQQTIADADLSHLARIPLIATIAAMVYENDQNSRLPTGRAGLYEKFVSHYLYGRTPIETVMHWVLHDVAAAADLSRPQLRAMLRNFLEEVADKHLAGPVDADLAAIVETSWSDVYPELRSVGAPPDWREKLRTMITSTGLVTSRGQSLHFVHRSLAEYLAAGVQARGFDYSRWVTQLGDPPRRSIALFVLARLDPDRRAEAIHRLRSDVSRVIEAGHVLADGVPMSAAAQRAIVARLFDHLHSGRVLVVDCIRVLVQLSSRPEVRAHLEELCANPAEPGWLRVQVAEKLHDVDRDLSNSLLRALVREPRLDNDVRSWAANRLAARGDEHGKLFADMRWGSVEWSAILNTGADTISSELTREAIVAILDDPDHKPSDRYNAALALAAEGDRNAVRTIIAIGHDIAAPESLRQTAAGWLADNGERVAAEACLKSILEDVVSFTGRFAIFEKLTRLDMDVPVDVVEQLASHSQLTTDRAHRVLAYLTESGPVGDAVPSLHALATNTVLDDEVRLTAARHCAEFGDAADLHEFLVALIRDDDSPDAYANTAVQVLSKGGTPAGLEQLAAISRDRSAPARRRELAYATLTQESVDRALALADQLTRARHELPARLHDAVLAVAARNYGRGGRAVVEREMANPMRSSLAFEAHDGRRPPNTSVELATREQRVIRIIADNIAQDELASLIPFIEDATKPLAPRRAALAGMIERLGGVTSLELRSVLLSEKLDPQLLLEALEGGWPASPARWQLLCDIYRGRPAARPMLVANLLKTAAAHSVDLTTDMMLEVFFDAELQAHHRAVALRRILNRDDHVGRECILHLVENEGDKSFAILHEASSEQLRKVLAGIAMDRSVSAENRLRAAEHMRGPAGSELLVALALQPETPQWAREACLHALLTRYDFGRVRMLVKGLRESTRPDAEMGELLDEIEAYLRPFLDESSKEPDDSGP